MTPINLNDYILRHAPETIEFFNSKYPNHADLFRKGRDMGEGTEKSISKANEARDSNSKIIAGIEYLSSSIETIKSESAKLIESLGNRSKRARKLKKISEGISTLGGGGLIVTLSDVTYIDQSLWLAVLTFTATIMSLFSEHIAGGAGGAELSSTLNETFDLNAKVFKTDRELKRLRLIEYTQTQVEQMLIEMDDIAMAFNKIELKMKII